MATIRFDTLKVARKLKEAGVPDKQAEAQANILADAFHRNFNALVANGYLDAGSAGQKTPTKAHMDNRFGRLEADVRNSSIAVDRRFAKQEAGMDVRFIKMDCTFLLLTWMLAAVGACTVVPTLYRLLN